MTDTADTTPQQTTSPRSPQLDMLFGYMPAQILHVAAQLGLADEFARGSRTSDELAAATCTHAPSLHRLLRALACLDVVAEVEPDRFELTEAGAQLRTDSPHSIRNLVELFCGDDVWRAWGNLLYSVRTGESAFEHVTGMTSFEAFEREPEKAATFNAAMADHTRQVAPGIIAGYTFSRFHTLVDVGGGDGTLIAAVLSAVPGLRGVLFDLTSGLGAAAETLASADVAGRCQVVAGDFFDSVPDDGDAYLLKSVVHDWDDEQAVEILRTCREAMPPGGALLVLEQLLPARMESPQQARSTVMSDLNMLVNTRGRERTEGEYRQLLARAGFEVTAVAGPFEPSSYCVIEGRPA